MLQEHKLLDLERSLTIGLVVETGCNWVLQRRARLLEALDRQRQYVSALLA